MKQLSTLMLMAALSSSSSLWSQIMPEKVPYTLRHSSTDFITTTIPLPAFTQEYIQHQLTTANPHGNLVALLQDADIKFPESAPIITTPDGMRVWQVKVTMPASKGLGLYFDSYQLPQGVEMFLYNEHKKHIKGTYSHLENNSTQVFATDPVQGSTIYLELNIPAQVNLEDIKLHIDQVASYIYNLPEFERYTDHNSSTPDLIDAHEPLSGSVCMINANCAQADGFEKQRQSTTRILFTDGTSIFSCNGALVNAADNVAGGTCHPYLITSSSCEITNATSGIKYSGQTIIRFKENPENCEDTSGPTHSSITGVYFKARSSFSGEPTEIKGDFLLMELIVPLPADWNIFYAGYNAGSVETSTTAPDKFVSFHHPTDATKKVTTYTSISSYDAGDVATHWHGIADEGYNSSLGAPLFDMNGRLIGIGSFYTVGYETPEECLVNSEGAPVIGTSKEMKYSQLAYNWSNPGDDGSPNTMLKTWLDPAGTDILMTNAVTVDCQTEYTSVSPTQVFNADINIYPNPSMTGEFMIQVMRTKDELFNIEVYNVAGQTVFKAEQQKLGATTRRLDLSHLNNGIYFLRLSNAYGAVTHKLMITP